MYKLLLILIVLLSISSNNAQSQNNTNSPYSMFGVGLVNSAGDSRSFSMGGAGIALSSKEGINTLNPSSIVGLDSLSFYINFQLKSDYTTITENQQSSNSFNSNFENMSFGFKANRWWGIAFGLTSYSNIGYNINTTEEIQGAPGQSYSLLYNGTGGISNVFVTNSFRLTKNFSAGIESSYIWGSITSTETADYESLSGAQIINTRNYNLNNFHFKYGLQYAGHIHSSAIYLGATYSRQTPLYTTYDQTIKYSSGNELLTKNEPTEDYLLSSKLGLGMGLALNKNFVLAADYQFNSAEGQSSPYQNATTKDAQLLSGGIEFTPTKNQFNKIFNRLKYRAGAFYNDTYLSISNYDIVESGISFGVNYPLRQTNNSLSLSYQYKVIQGPITEIHHTVKLGFTWTEYWFYKQKFQ